MLKRLLLLSLLVLTFWTCNKDEKQINTADFGNTVAVEWSRTTLDMIKRTPGFTPPVVARTLGYASLTMYEAAVGGMPENQSMAGQVQGLNVSDMPVASGESYNWPIVINAAMREILESCLGGAKAENVDIITDKFYSLNNKLQVGLSDELVNRSIEYGAEVGRAVSRYAASDNQLECFKNNFPSTYNLVSGPGLWIPTNAQKVPLQPYWGNVRTFSAANTTSDIEPHTPYSTDKNSKFYSEALEVYNAVNKVTEEEKTIALYWADNPGETSTPPGHSFSIATQLLEDEKANLAKSVETLAKIGMAVHDAFVCCWRSKYKYNLMRPITYINNVIDPKWKTVIPTPPFPEYTSGHSVQSGATAEILTNIYGDNFAFTDRTHIDRTDITLVPRNFKSFKAFADEAAVSRLFGGIHYNQAISVGVSQGTTVAKNILALKFKK